MISTLIRMALSPAGKAVGALLAIAAISAALYGWGHADGRAKLLAQLADDRITILKDGKAIDDDVLAADDDDLCALLGGCL